MTVQLLIARPAHAKPGVILQSKDDRRLHTDNQKAPDRGFGGLWRSPSGSLYVFNGGSFICVFIHSGRFLGWLNKVAVKDVCKLGDQWSGKQAFRNPQTGALNEWVDISLELQIDKVIKYFPAHVPGVILVHGHVEVYDRIKDV